MIRRHRNLSNEIHKEKKAVSSFENDTIIDSTLGKNASKEISSVAAKTYRSRFIKLLRTIKNQLSLAKIGILAMALVLIISIITSVYFYSKYNKVNVLGSNSEQNIEDLIKKIGKIVVLPNEQPTVATVSDVEKLKDQPFFKKAQNGDKVLIYQNSQKALLYRPKINKIIDFTSVNISNTSQPKKQEIANNTPTLIPSPTLIETETIEVVIFNGTTTKNLTLKAKEKIDKLVKMDVIERGNAQKDTYVKNLIVNLSNINQTRINELAKTFNADIVSIPEGEQLPSKGNVLLILGSDFTEGD